MEKKKQPDRPVDRYANLSPEAKLIAMAEAQMAPVTDSATGREAVESGGKT